MADFILNGDDGVPKWCTNFVMLGMATRRLVFAEINLAHGFVIHQ
jgi:hypothetical protein